MESLDGKVALVTGASSGIGRACARALSQHGVRVALAGRDQARLDAAAAGLPSPTTTLTGDVSSAGFGETAVATTVREFGSLDIVLSNAGLYLPGDFAESDVQAMQQLLSVNVFGAMAVARAALPVLLEAGQGDVVMTSSVSGHQSIHWEPIYSASKHAVQAFTHGVRRQLVGTGVRLGAIAPGMVLNELWGYSEEQDEDPDVASMLAEGRGITSEDVAEAGSRSATSSSCPAPSRSDPERGIRFPRVEDAGRQLDQGDLGLPRVRADRPQTRGARSRHRSILRKPPRSSTARPHSRRPPRRARSSTRPAPLPGNAAPRVRLSGFPQKPCARR